jgi:ATP-dependent 26S proteasome regulatory subunit
LFDFYAHRERLFALGLPRKRALLFYGPPGTGKTHTCRFIHTRLSGITTILATGESLTRLQDIGKLARQLQPTLVILEDVDLVFHSREINPYGVALGDLMDQLDGFTPDEDVIFVLTTNAIERVESAIRDRPGRINQCLFFGMPNPDLRRRYLLQYLKPYNVAAVDLDHIVKLTDGTSQAFMKEYVLRAVQVAADSNGYPENGVALKTEHFDVAFDELTSHGDPSGHAIMGFRTAGKNFGVKE